MSASNPQPTLKKTFALVVLVFLFFTFFAFPFIAPVQAQEGQAEPYVPLAPIGGYLPNNTADDLTGYLNGLFKLGVAVATGLAVVMITLGAIEYMSTDAINGKEEGKDKITSALWGLVLALGAYLLLNTINPDLLRTTPTIPTTNVGTVPGLAADWTTIGPAPGTGAFSGSTPGSNESVNQMVAALNDRGITNPNAIAAILAQANAESGFNPTLNTPEAGGSHGLFQVSDNVWNNYTAWAASNGYSVDSQYAQTYYMVGNYQRVDQSSWTNFQTASTPTAALDAWRHWNYGGVNLPQRYDSANQYYQNYQQNQSWGH